jgi:acyl carrier protein
MALTIAERARKLIAEHLDHDIENAADNASMMDDLGADSLDNVELLMAFEEEFDVEITDDEAENLLTVGDVIKALETKLAGAQS